MNEGIIKNVFIKYAIKVQNYDQFSDKIFFTRKIENLQDSKGNFTYN